MFTLSTELVSLLKLVTLCPIQFVRNCFLPFFSMRVPAPVILVLTSDAVPSHSGIHLALSTVGTLRMRVQLHRPYAIRMSINILWNLQKVAHATWLNPNVPYLTVSARVPKGFSFAVCIHSRALFHGECFWYRKTCRLFLSFNCSILASILKLEGYIIMNYL